MSVQTRVSAQELQRELSKWVSKCRASSQELQRVWAYNPMQDDRGGFTPSRSLHGDISPHVQWTPVQRVSIRVCLRRSCNASWTRGVSRAGRRECPNECAATLMWTLTWTALFPLLRRGAARDSCDGHTRVDTHADALTWTLCAEVATRARRETSPGWGGARCETGGCARPRAGSPLPPSPRAASPTVGS